MCKHSDEDVFTKARSAARSLELEGAGLQPSGFGPSRTLASRTVWRSHRGRGGGGGRRWGGGGGSHQGMPCVRSR